MRAPLLGVLGLLTVACSNSSPPPAAADAKAATPASPAEPSAEPPPVVAAKPIVPLVLPTVAAETKCADASLALDPSTVVARVGDKDVTFGELGEDAQKAEREALFTYCRDTQRVRQAAVDRAVDDAVLSEAATAKNTDIEGYLRTEVMEKVPDPSDKEIAAYYDANKSDDAPPLDQVMARVVQVMKDERAKEAYGAHLEKLRKKASVQVALPDVRPPAQPIEIPEHTATFGPADAAVTIVEFSDFECPYCSRAVPAVDELKKRYGDKVRFAFRHFPLSFHPRARPAAKVAHCAGAQDKFWPVHDGIFATQRDLSDAALRGVAAKAGVDPGKLDACLNAPETDAAIEADIEAARAAGVEGTPSFYVNGRPYDGPISGEGFARAIEQELAAG